MVKNQKLIKKMIAPLEPIKKKSSTMSTDRIDTPVERSSNLKRHESPIVNMNHVFRDGSAMPNSRSVSPTVPEGNLVD
jgi:hypothetical protein